MTIIRIGHLKNEGRMNYSLLTRKSWMLFLIYSYSFPSFSEFYLKSIDFIPIKKLLSCHNNNLIFILFSNQSYWSIISAEIFSFLRNDWIRKFFTTNFRSNLSTKRIISRNSWDIYLCDTSRKKQYDKTR